jgi:hypothetical protein
MRHKVAEVKRRCQSATHTCSQVDQLMAACTEACSAPLGWLLDKDSRTQDICKHGSTALLAAARCLCVATQPKLTGMPSLLLLLPLLLLRQAASWASC